MEMDKCEFVVAAVIGQKNRQCQNAVSLHLQEVHGKQRRTIEHLCGRSFFG
jgi:hypothetical protein